VKFFRIKERGWKSRWKVWKWFNWYWYLF